MGKLTHIFDAEQRAKESETLVRLSESVKELAQRIVDQRHVLMVKDERQDVADVLARVGEMVAEILQLKSTLNGLVDEFVALSALVEAANGDAVKALVNIDKRLQKKPEPKVYDVQLDGNGVISRIVAK